MRGEDGGDAVVSLAVLLKIDMLWNRSEFSLCFAYSASCSCRYQAARNGSYRRKRFEVQVPQKHRGESPTSALMLRYFCSFLFAFAVFTDLLVCTYRFAASGVRRADLCLIADAGFASIPTGMLRFENRNAAPLKFITAFVDSFALLSETRQQGA